MRSCWAGGSAARCCSRSPSPCSPRTRGDWRTKPAASGKWSRQARGDEDPPAPRIPGNARRRGGRRSPTARRRWPASRPLARAAVPPPARSAPARCGRSTSHSGATRRSPASDHAPAAPTRSPPWSGWRTSATVGRIPAATAPTGRRTRRAGRPSCGSSRHAYASPRGARTPGSTRSRSGQGRPRPQWVCVGR